jgi:hypothetical protein
MLAGMAWLRPTDGWAIAEPAGATGPGAKTTGDRFVEVAGGLATEAEPVATVAGSLNELIREEGVSGVLPGSTPATALLGSEVAVPAGATNTATGGIAGRPVTGAATGTRRAGVATDDATSAVATGSRPAAAVPRSGTESASAAATPELVAGGEVAICRTRPVGSTAAGSVPGGAVSAYAGWRDDAHATVKTAATSMSPIRRPPLRLTSGRVPEECEDVRSLAAIWELLYHGHLPVIRRRSVRDKDSVGVWDRAAQSPLD